MNSLFVLNSAGSFMMEKHFNRCIPRSCCKPIIEHLQDSMNPKSLPTVVHSDSAYVLINIWDSDLVFIAVVTSEVHSFLILEQLSTFIAVIKSQFNDFGEDLFRTHFSTLHLLLSEMFDSGLPSSMEPNILGMIIQPFTTMNLAKALVSGGPTKMLSNLASSFGLAKGTMDIASPDSVINLNGIGEGMGVGSGYGTGSGISGSGSDTWWRRGSASYSKNEVLIDVLEKFNCCLDRDGKVLNGSISGEIQVQSHLSETPELRLTLRDPTLVADAALHSCVRMQRFERDNSICFCPPEGRFSLASYWIPNVKLPPPVLLRGSLSSSTIKNSAAAQFVVSRNYRAGRLDTTQKATCDLEDVAIRIHLPSFVTDSTITSSVGTTTFNVQDKTVFWSIGKLSQTMGAVPAEGTVSLESRQESSISSKCLSGTRYYAEVFFTSNDWAMSGLRVNSLDISSVNYTPSKGCFYSTSAGIVEFRF